MVHRNKATHFPSVPKKPPTKAAKQWAKFRNEDRRGMATKGRPLANRGKFAKVADAIGRKPTKEEYKRLKDAGYNQYSHTVSVRKKKDGSLGFSVKKKKGTPYKSKIKGSRTDFSY